MLTLHTFTNVYNDGGNYHQFIQRGRQSLLDSQALGSGHTLRRFMETDVIGECEAFDERQQRLLAAVLETGDITKVLSYAERCCLREHPTAEHACHTHFGEWTFDSLVLDPPSLREQQEDVWSEVPDFPKEDWKYEVDNGATFLGYWEWVENQRDMATQEA